MTKTLRRLLRDERGTSMMEATLVLPVMAICWAAVFLQFRSIEAKLDAAAQARLKAWDATVENCQHVQGSLSGPSESSGSSMALGWLATVCDVPVIGEVIGSLLGYSYNATAESKPFKAPGLFGGGTHKSQASHYILCNEPYMTMMDVVKNAVCKQIASINLDFDFAIDCPPDRHADVKDFCDEQKQQGTKTCIQREQCP